MMIVLSTIPKKSFQPKILVFTFPILVDVMHSDMSLIVLNLVTST